MKYVVVSVMVENVEHGAIYWGTTDSKSATSRFLAEFPQYAGFPVSTKVLSDKQILYNGG